MALAQAMLQEFDHEMRTTRTLLERVSRDEAHWRPHEKSWTLGELAAHIANLPVWGTMTVRETALDLDAPPADMPPRAAYIDTAALLETFDRNVREARAAISSADDEVLVTDWTLQAGGRDVFTMPRLAVIRSFVMNHLIHHRGQLSVYLRLRDIPVPFIYGPTADESVPT